MKIGYQTDYAAGRLQMYDRRSREQKARRMVKTLEDIYGPKKIINLTVLDIGSSTGIIDNFLAKKFKKVIGLDIDTKAVKFAKENFKRKNLEFRIGDAMKIDFKDNTFDIVICAHIYEHVPDSTRLFSEIYRVLRPRGVCYLAAINRLWPWEVHYNLPFLSWLPKSLANLYVRMTGRARKYYENPRTYWGLKELAKKFRRTEYTQKILRNPDRFGYADVIKPPLKHIAWVLSPLSKYFSPTFFWLLMKS